MPAGSDQPGPGRPEQGPALPRTFRPYGVRIAISVLGVLLVTTVLVLWFAFPPHIRAEFTIGQLATIGVLGAMFYGVGHALVRSRVVARPEGLTVVNGYRSRHLEWNQVLAISLSSGSPWATLDLADGTTMAAMGIQGSDGVRAARAVREVRRLLETNTH